MIRHPPSLVLIINMGFHGVYGVLVPQRLGNILAHQPRIAADPLARVSCQ